MKKKKHYHGHGNELKALLVDSLIIDHEDGMSAGFLSYFFNQKKNYVCV